MSEKENQTLMEKIRVGIQKLTGKKIVVLGIAGTVVVIAGIVAASFWIAPKEENGRQNSPMFDVNGNNEVSIVTASGTTSLGYTMDEFEPDYIETELYVEEVYLSSGDEVSEGTAVFKITDESIQEAREELEKKKEEASLAYRAGLISYEQSKINAKYTYDTAVLEGQQAEAVYQSALKNAEEKLQKAKDEVVETEQNIEEYENAYTSYYYDYHLDTYKERYEQNNNYYYTFMGEFGFQESDLTGVGAGTSIGNGNQSGMPGNSGDGSDSSSTENDSDSGSEAEENGSETEDSRSEDEGSGSESEGDGSKTEEGEAEGSISETKGSGSESEGDGSKTEEGEAEGSVSETEGSGSESEGSTGGTEENISGTNGNENRIEGNENETEGSGSETIIETEDTSDSENYSRRLKIVRQMKKNKENSENYYYKAWDEYEAAAEKAAEQLPKLTIQIETLRKELAEAESTYQIEVLEAETTYKKALAQTKLAQSDYNASIQKAEDELEALEDEKTEAQENLEEFETLLGDGYFYTKNAGTIMMVGTQKESNLQGGSMVVAYRNTEDISVTVSVAQEDIHKLEVGDSTQVMVEGYGTYEGKITYLNPISNSDSRTNITYEVIVDLIGDDVSSLKENLTTTVIFE